MSKMGCRYKQGKREFKKKAEPIIKMVFDGEPLKKVKTRFEYIFPTKAKRDCNNFDKCVFDILVECGVIEDDNLFVIVEHSECGKYEKGCLGVRILVEEVE